METKDLELQTEESVKQILSRVKRPSAVVVYATLALTFILAFPAWAKHTASRVVYGPDYLYVTVKGQRFFYVVDRDQNRLLKKVSVASPPCGGFITDDGKQFYIALGELDRIAVVDTATNTIEAEIPLSEGSGRYMDPGGMAVSPDGATIFVANESGDSLSIVDLMTRQVMTHIPVGFGPQDVALSPDGQYAYLTDFYSIWVIDTHTRSPKEKVALRDPGSNQQRTMIQSDGEEMFRGPRDIVMSPDGKTAYIALEDSGEIAILKTESNRLEKTISVGSYPGGLALSPDGKALYIAHRDSDQVSVLDTGLGKVIQKIKVGNDPWDIALSPEGDTAFVVNQAEPSISVIDTKSFSVKTTIVLGMLKMKNLLPRGLRRLFYVRRKERKRVKHIPFASAIFAVLFLLPFVFTMLVGGFDSAASKSQKALAGTASVFEKEIRGSPSYQTRKIAFESRRTGNWEIFLMNADGTNQVRLTHTNADNRAPFWASDGKRIAFVSNRDGNKEIYVMNADGSSPVNLSRSRGDDFSPSWSPDGSKIAFVSTRDGKRNVYVMNTDGNRQVRLSSEGDNWNPNWSPDSQKLAFVANHRGNNEIYLMDANGKNQTNLTRHPAEDGRGSHSWSPDGSRIAWVTNRDGNWEIYVMNADGSNPVNVTRHPAEEGIGMFVWSPDGKQIAFISTRDSNEEVYIVNTDGTGSANLSRSPAMDDVPLWSPDGQRLAFVSNRTGFDEIYVMDVDGKHQEQLTFTRTKEDYPRWQP
jgi:YVTN family beta-propeller protein